MSQCQMTVRGAGLLFFSAIFTGWNPALAQEQEDAVKSSQEIIEALSGGQVRTRGIVIEASREKAAAKIDLYIGFEFGSDRLSSQAQAQVAALGEALSNPRLSEQAFDIIGHTDAVGSAAYNMQLSSARAAAVRNYLLENHELDPERLSARGMGEEQLLPDVPPEHGSNRRVEIRTR